MDEFMGKNQDSPRENISIEISKAKPEDWPEVKRIRLEALEKDAESFGAKLENVVNAPDDIWKEKTTRENEPIILAKNGDKAVGMVAIWKRPKEENTWGVISLYVSINFRTKNVGRNILQKAEEEIKNRGGQKAVLYFREGKKELQAFYEKSGYRLIPEGKYEIWERMEKNLI